MMQLSAIQSPVVNRAKAPAGAARLVERQPAAQSETVRFGANNDDFLDKAKEIASKAAEPYTKRAPKQKAVINYGAAGVVGALTLFGPVGWIIGVPVTGALIFNGIRNWNKDK